MGWANNNMDLCDPNIGKINLFLPNRMKRLKIFKLNISSFYTIYRRLSKIFKYLGSYRKFESVSHKFHEIVRIFGRNSHEISGKSGIFYWKFQILRYFFNANVIEILKSPVAFFLNTRNFRIFGSIF